MNLYAYAGNNPIGFSDPFGLWPPKTHDKIIALALRQASAADVSSIQTASRDFNASISSQRTKNSFMHSMRSAGQSASEATTLRGDFIARNMSDAIAAEGRGEHDDAMVSLGIAMHAVMDATSPAHMDKDGNPQVWRLRDFRKHKAQESKAPTPTQQDAMNAMLGSMYDEVMAAGKENQ